MITFFIRRPIFASSIAIIMVLTGLISFRFLPVSQFPDITPPEVTVTANYPGAKMGRRIKKEIMAGSPGDRRL